jgi:hypothetical protein
MLTVREVWELIDSRARPLPARTAQPPPCVVVTALSCSAAAASASTPNQRPN